MKTVSAKADGFEIEFTKPVDKKTVADTGVDIAPRLEVVTTEEPEARKAGVILSSVGELVDKLKNEAGVI